MSRKWYVFAVVRLLVALAIVPLFVGLLVGQSAASPTVVVLFAFWCWWAYHDQATHRRTR